MKRWLKGIALSILCVGLFLLAAVRIFPLKGDIPVLMYHFLSEESEGSNNYVRNDSFKKQMGLLKWLGFRVISLWEYEEIRKGIRKPQGREIVITFDDGNKSFAHSAFPVLQAYRFPVAMFFITDGLRGDESYGSMSQQLAQTLMKDPILTVGSHTKTHAHLPEIDLQTAEEEIRGSKTDLRDMLGVPVDYFAYPYGQLNADLRQKVKNAGYHLAFTTAYKKLGTLDEDDFSITRVKITGSSDNLFVFWVKVSGLYSRFKAYRYRVQLNR